MKLIRIVNNPPACPVVDQWFAGELMWRGIETICKEHRETERKNYSYFLLNSNPETVYRVVLAGTTFLNGSGEVLTRLEGLYRISRQAERTDMGPEMVHISIPSESSF